MRQSVGPKCLWQFAAGLLLVAALGQACGDGGSRGTGPSRSTRIQLNLKGIKGVKAAQGTQGLPPGCTGQITVTPPGQTFPITGDTITVTVPAGVEITIVGTIDCGAGPSTAEAKGTFPPNQTGTVNLVFSGALPVLHVTVVGNGTVTGPGGFSCTGACQKAFLPGEQVGLTADPSSGQFSGAGCNQPGACTVTMNGDQSVTITFTSATPATPATGIIQVSNPSCCDVTVFFTGAGPVAPLLVPGSGNGTRTGVVPGPYVATNSCDSSTVPFAVNANQTTFLVISGSGCG